MRVLVTGGTGLVGCHTAAALARAGYEVRLLVRSVERMARALAPLGVGSVDHVVGDVTDPVSVGFALAGCEAVVHAAAIYTMDLRREAEVERTNVRGTELVLGEAARRDLDPIVHVSSVSALSAGPAPSLTPDAAVAAPRDMYARTKAKAEHIARGLQREGHPVAIAYPGGIWGPHDPTVGDGVTQILRYLKMGAVPTTPGGIPLTDVRDLATVIVSLMKPGRGARRYMVGGHFLSPLQLAQALGRVTDRRLLTFPVPGALLRALGRGSDLVQGVSGFALGPSYEAMLTLTHGVPCDNSATAADLGVVPRSPDETLGDALRWMYAEGILSARAVGQLASPTSAGVSG